MRILACVTYYLPHRTGLTLHAQRLAEGLARRGHQITVLSARFRRDLAPEENVGGVRVLRLRAPWRISRGLVMPGYPGALWRELERHDLVHVHTPMLEAGLVATLAGARRRPLVLTHHGDLTLPRGAMNRVIERAVAVLAAPALRRARRVIAYSRDYADHSTFLAPRRRDAVEIPPPVEVAEVEPERIEQWRRRLDVVGRRVIGFAGRFVEEKRPDLLLRALPRIAGEFPDAVAVFAGAHHLPYERFFERCAPLVDSVADRVRFAGLLDDPRDLAAFYAMCEVLVLPSQSECFGLVQPEAMLAGTPVVASDVPGVRVPIQVSEMGRLVRPGDVDSLAEGVCAVLHDRGRFCQPRERVARQWDLERTIGLYEEALTETAAASDLSFHGAQSWKRS
jgi:glycosyltransferase involved in cell wall biosynthesis